MFLSNPSFSPISLKLYVNPVREITFSSGLSIISIFSLSLSSEANAVISPATTTYVPSNVKLPYVTTLLI